MIMSKQKLLPFALVALIPSSSSSCCVALAVFTHLGLAILAKCTTGFVFYQNGNWIAHALGLFSLPDPVGWCEMNQTRLREMWSLEPWDGLLPGNSTKLQWHLPWPSPLEGNVTVSLEQHFLTSNGHSWFGVEHLTTLEVGTRFIFFFVNLRYCTVINEKIKIKHGKFSAVLGHVVVTKFCIWAVF